jgi:ribosomal protein S8
MISKNKKIRNATTCSNGTITFKSKLEKTLFNVLLEKGFKPQYEPKTIILWEGFTPVTPFYDKESDSQWKKRIEEDDSIKNRLLTLKNSKIVGIRYTPDIYLKYNNLDIWIEFKGNENEVFYIKKKLFRAYLDKKFIETGQKSIFFEIYTKRQLLQAIDIIKNYE